MTKKTTKVFTSENIENLLSNRFSPPAWAFLPQVRNGTGYAKAVRTADALAMGLYPSRGLYLHGFEIKVHRSDWINELKNPAKAEAIAQFCDYWWIVAPKDIVKSEELPSNWGLMIPYGATTKIIKEAKQLKSKNPDKVFLAGVLRKAQETITPTAELRENYIKGREVGRKNAENTFKWAKDDHRKLQQAVREFEKASGVKIDTWQNNKEIGEAVKMVLSGAHLRNKQRLNNLLGNAEQIVLDIKENLKENKNDKKT